MRVKITIDKLIAVALITTDPSALWAFDLATSVFLLLVRHSINKFILCSYFERRLP